MTPSVPAFSFNRGALEVINNINYMSFVPKTGEWKTEWMDVTTSTAFDRGDIVKLSSGKVAKAAASDNAVDLVGIIDKTIASTDDDYADDRQVPVLIPKEKHAKVEADVTTGTLAATSEGVEMDLDDESGVDQGTTTKKHVKCVNFISSSKGLFYVKFNGSY